MPNVTFYFEVHQPYRLKRVYSFIEDKEFIDYNRNKEIFNKITDKCYIPMTKLLISLAKEYPEFKVNFSLTGTFMEQAEMFRPEVIQLFQELFDTGNMELLDETYYHSLSFLIDKEEFIAQVKQHKSLMYRYFKFHPKVFRNTEALYSNDIANSVAKLGYTGILAEGWDRVLGWRSPNYVYTNPENNIKVLLRNYKLSDDVAFRFSTKTWSEFPLTAEKYANWIANNEGDTVNLFMDYETFGEHQWNDTGIFEFMKDLPGKLISKGVGFNKVSEAIKSKPVGAVDVPYYLSWADMDRDLSAWLGNQMQDAAFNKLKEMEQEILSSGNKELINRWRILQTSDNFYYMCTKWFADGDIHKYFNAYTSPYIAYLNYMNVISHLDSTVKSFLKLHHTP
ncbi:MAG: Alpha-amylase [Candidatus Parvarchaeum acidophilus ARMAN-5]|jgi:alpha-amylase|uniref:Alpha-amylase n=1 Tax=Candidatus Parvarchaeum acidophilus ARMAN-5 TaxID=662762 RepID=D6GV35_PARA5|nr:MAG: Alpha-amylase [Candidatus Parvarchaeum acidophilus ARMAN-5]